jgi:hypothetical protein
VIVFGSWTPHPSRISRRSAHLQPGSRHQLELVEPEHVGSFRYERRDHWFLVRLAAQESGWLLVQVLVPPLPQSAEGDVEVAALGGESVLVAGRSLAWVVLASLAAVKASQGQSYQGQSYRYLLTMRLVR